MTDAYPSAALLGQLEETLREPNPALRSARAWRLVVQATANPDAGIVQDFATDNGLVVPLVEKRVRTEQGPREALAWVNPCDGSEMVWIPPGPLVHGRMTRKGPLRATVPGFSLARHPVTNAQFKRFLDETGYRPPEWHPRNDLFLAHWEDGKPPARQEAHPVTWVSFVDALSYCRWAGLTLRLPGPGGQRRRVVPEDARRQARGAPAAPGGGRAARGAGGDHHGGGARQLLPALRRAADGGVAPAEAVADAAQRLGGLPAGVPDAGAPGVGVGVASRAASEVVRLTATA
jgi:hypothetical protein